LLSAYKFGVKGVESVAGSWASFNLCPVNPEKGKQKEGIDKEKNGAVYAQCHDGFGKQKQIV
jgi:hypothetical protein